MPQVLRRTRGSIELVDASQLLPGLKRTPGLRRWRPFDKQKQAFFDTHDEARAVRQFSRDSFTCACSRGSDHPAMWSAPCLASKQLGGEHVVGKEAWVCLRRPERRTRLHSCSAITAVDTFP